MKAHNDNRGCTDCDAVLEIVSASLDGEATVAEIDRATESLLVCASCREMAEALEADDDLLRRLGSPKPVRRSAPRRWVALAAVLIVAVTLAVLLRPPVDRTLAPELAARDAPAVDVAPAVSVPEQTPVSTDFERLLEEAEALIVDTTIPRTPKRPNPFTSRSASSNPFASPTVPRIRRES
ncbi:MAG: hypothetical protein AAGD38_18450 [Acidobacteriota bacterium]